MPVIGAVCTERNACVGVFYGYIVAVASITVEFEQVGDPVVGVVPFEVEQQLDRQLAGFDVAGYCEQFAVVGIEGIEHHVIHFKGQLVVAVVGFYAHQFCFFKVFPEGGLDDFCFVCRVSKAAGYTDGKE